MFSGIVEATARVKALRHEGDNILFYLECPFVDELTIDQSVSHNGVCLTVMELPGDGSYAVTAVQETLDRSNLGSLEVGSLVNLERSMRVNGRLDGHIVQGHVDTTAVCQGVDELDGSWRYRFIYRVPRDLARRGYITVDKGSVTVNGVSLTVCNPTEQVAQDDDSLIEGSFEVAIIPYSDEHTYFKEILPGTRVNIEFDIIGKYLAAMSRINEL